MDLGIILFSIFVTQIILHCLAICSFHLVSSYTSSCSSYINNHPVSSSDRLRRHRSGPHRLVSHPAHRLSASQSKL